MSETSNTLPADLSQTDAIKVLIRAVQVAQEKGAYTLQEAALVHQAVSKFIVTPPEETDGGEEGDEDEPTVNNTGDVN